MYKTTSKQAMPGLSARLPVAAPLGSVHGVEVVHVLLPQDGSLVLIHVVPVRDAGHVHQALLQLAQVTGEQHLPHSKQQGCTRRTFDGHSPSQVH
jgi:hypothetical protein